MSAGMLRRMQFEGRPDGPGHLAFRCPGCGEHHVVGVRQPNSPSWTWDGSESRPVLSPSLLARGALTEKDADGFWNGEWKRDQQGEPVPYVCHSFIGCNGAQPGQIIFLSDCTHALAGQAVDLPEIPPGGVI